MHISTFNKMELLKQAYAPAGSNVLEIEDLSFTPLFKDCQYRTLHARNVHEQALWNSIEDETQDVVISYMHLQNDPFFWKKLHNMAGLCREEGYIIIAVPDVYEGSFYFMGERVFKSLADYMTCTVVDNFLGHECRIITMQKIAKKIA